MKIQPHMQLTVGDALRHLTEVEKTPPDEMKSNKHFH